jgi:hypothetical protein
MSQASSWIGSFLVNAFLHSIFRATITDAKFGCKTGNDVSIFTIRIVEGTIHGEESDGKENCGEEAGCKEAGFIEEKAAHQGRRDAQMPAAQQLGPLGQE